ncbi:hypothetical protein BD410DRAFT_786944 [Rickenella mellea]|uniref:Uncharacterized protein n=1 Tax=Rickenella mellea TaxID=50990 RepID=A0A4Y7Q7Q1_9AGAM|nr:hypothetical protein BD410DRAFT_786944 [Rickenella mellea]
MLYKGDVAVASVQGQVMVVQAAKSYSKRDQALDVYIYQPFGSRVFISPQTPLARISPRDIFTIFTASDGFRPTDLGMLELTQHAYAEFVELSSYNQHKIDAMWNQLKAKTIRL